MKRLYDEVTFLFCTLLLPYLLSSTNMFLLHFFDKKVEDLVSCIVVILMFYLEMLWPFKTKCLILLVYNCLKLVGTDEATTCVGLVIRNPRNGMWVDRIIMFCLRSSSDQCVILNNGCRVSVAHMDFVGVVDMGLRQMLSMIVEDDENPILDVCVSFFLWAYWTVTLVTVKFDAVSHLFTKLDTQQFTYELQVHLIGGFEDAPSGVKDWDPTFWLSYNMVLIFFLGLCSLLTIIPDQNTTSTLMAIQCHCALKSWKLYIVVLRDFKSKHYVSLGITPRKIKMEMRTPLLVDFWLAQTKFFTFYCIAWNTILEFNNK